MNTYKLIAVALACAALVACASPEPAQTAKSDANDVQCIKQTPTGSHMTRNDCRTAEQRAKDREESEKYIRQQRTLDRPTGPTN